MIVISEKLDLMREKLVKSQGIVLYKITGNLDFSINKKNCFISMVRF